METHAFLIFACHTKGDVRDPAILVMLLSVGANPNTQTENGITALMFTVYRHWLPGRCEDSTQCWS